MVAVQAHCSFLFQWRIKERKRSWSRWFRTLQSRPRTTHPPINSELCTTTAQSKPRRIHLDEYGVEYWCPEKNCLASRSTHPRKMRSVLLNMTLFLSWLFSLVLSLQRDLEHHHLFERATDRSADGLQLPFHMSKLRSRYRYDSVAQLLRVRRFSFWNRSSPSFRSLATLR